MVNYSRAVCAVTKRIVIEQFQEKRTIFFWVLFPSLMLILFGLVYSGIEGSMTASFSSTAPGILTGAAFFFSCLTGPILILVAERERNTLKRLLLSPLSGTAYFLGIYLAHLIIALMQTTIVYGITYAFGGRFYGAPLTGLLIIFLSIASYTGLGFLFGATVSKQTENVVGPAAAIGVPLLALGGTFFSISLLPPYLVTANIINPVFHMNQALKAVSSTGAALIDVGHHVLFLAVFSIASLTVGALLYTRMLHKEKT